MSDDRYADETSDKSRSTVGTTSNDRLGMTQVKVDCSGCSKTVTHAEQLDCGCMEGA